MNRVVILSVLACALLGCGGPEFTVAAEPLARLQQDGAPVADGTSGGADGDVGDGGVDPSPDAAPDGKVSDASPDAPDPPDAQDAGFDVVDAAPEADPLEASVDAGVDAGADAGDSQDASSQDAAFDAYDGWTCTPITPELVTTTCDQTNSAATVHVPDHMIAYSAQQGQCFEPDTPAECQTCAESYNCGCLMAHQQICPGQGTCKVQQGALYLTCP